MTRPSVSDCNSEESGAASFVVAQCVLDMDLLRRMTRMGGAAPAPAEFSMPDDIATVVAEQVCLPAFTGDD